MIDPIFFSRVVETDWKRELGQSYMICVKEKKDEKRGALCCVLCYSNSSGGGGLGFYFFILLAFFFQHVKKLLNVWNFVNIKVAKSKLDHLGFYCKLDFFDRTIRKFRNWNQSWVLIGGTPCIRKSNLLCKSFIFFSMLLDLVFGQALASLFLTKAFRNFWA